jgi:MFS family permease
MLVFPLLSALITPFSGALADRTSYGLLVTLGLFFTAAGLYFTANMPLEVSLWQIIGGQAVLGLGNALFQPANNSIVMGVAPADKLGIASGINALARNMGLVIGTATAVAVFDYQRLHYTQSILSQTAAAPEMAAFISAYHDSMLVAALTAAAGFLLSLKQSNYLRKNPMVK